MTMKNPLSVTLVKRSQLNTGWYHFGNWLKIMSEKTVVKAEQSTVNSKKMGRKNAGTVRQSKGLPCTMSG